jgi:3-hydroxyacyl-CoA dehydrogenase/enoyl-CoA hydratase/3-hydroxybutyryl-CoA epimerase/enoyl-CoA isomerase
MHPEGAGELPAVFSGEYVTVRELGEGLVALTLDRRGETINKLDTGFIAELAQALASIRHRPDLRGVLLDSAHDAFLAGADLQVLLALCEQPAPALVAFSRDNGAVLTALAELPVPVVAAINGYALGGGLELALCADYRVLESAGRVGLPEVGLGVIPGWGGCARLPRLIGGDAALDWIVDARPRRAAEAQTAGLVDALATTDQLCASALDWLRRAAAGELDWQARRRQRDGSFSLDPARLAEARSRAARRAHHYPAPLAAVELLAASAPLALDAALQREADCFAELARTPTARALIGVFLTNQALKKQGRRHANQGAPVARAAVLGAGIMGGGIAQVSAAAGIPVLLKEVAAPALARGVEAIRSQLQRQVEGGRLAEDRADAIAASITPTLNYEGFDEVGLVVEAIIEELAVKRATFAELEAVVPADAVLASNTSSLAIADIGAALARPQRLVGLHFFNPVPLMPLVEVIRGPATSAEALATAVGYVNAIGKTPLVVKDCPGFLVNRLLGAYFTAFLQLVREGVAFTEIDRVMEGWGWPMGPAYLMDVAGIDTIDRAMAVLGEAYPRVMAARESTAIQLFAGAGRLGQKSGSGFYRHETDERGRSRRQPDPAAAALLTSIQVDGQRRVADTEIEERMMLAMALEAARCLEQAVVSSAAELDAAMRLATGFPAHHGGPLWYADTLGLATLRQRCQHYAERLGGLYTVSDLIERLAASGGRFHGTAAA